MVLESDTVRCANEDAGTRRRWIVRSHIDWEGNKSFFIRIVKLERSLLALRKHGPRTRWIMRSHVDWKGNESFFIRIVKHIVHSQERKKYLNMSLVPQ